MTDLSLNYKVFNVSYLVQRVTKFCFAIVFQRFTNQKSNAVYLKKGRYYYMEAIMKDDHQIDHLEVGLQTPDKTIYTVIPSKFLWTTQRYVGKRYSTLYPERLISSNKG